ncbi:MAG: radical SAM protein [Bacteroidota bacterium]
MYKSRDYFQRGTRMLHNRVFPRRRRISTLMVYATDLCDSRCQHCLIWQKRPVKYLGMDKILGLMENRCVSRHTKVGLEGGEFLLHPESRDIITWFHEHHPNFDLLSNCLKPDKLIEAVRKTPPVRLYISLDGTKETYREMRGKDGYDKVLKVIESLKATVPISVMYCVSPFNTMEDLRHVAEVCKFHSVDLRVGVYSDIKFFDTEEAAYQAETLGDIPKILKEFRENYDYLALYDEWRAGKLVLPCKSILDSVVVLPNGDVPICMNLDDKLGSIHENTLDEILAMDETVATLQDRHDNCNACWINFHRKYDLILYRNLERFFPRGLVSKLFGYYQWSDDPKRKYREIVAK